MALIPRSGYSIVERIDSELLFPGGDKVLIYNITEIKHFQILIPPELQNEGLVWP